MMYEDEKTIEKNRGAKNKRAEVRRKIKNRKNEGTKYKRAEVPRRHETK